MADYHPLITRAVDGLATSTAEARRSLYERARTALVAQLRGVNPPLSEAEITRERLALEDAIRKVEAESVRKARTEPRAPATAARPANSGNRPAAAPPPVPSAWRDRPSTASGDAQPPPPPPPPLRPDKRLADTARNDPPPLRKPIDPVPNEASRPEGQSSARSRLLGARGAPAPREEMKGFRGPKADDVGAAYSPDVPPLDDIHDQHSGAPSAKFSREEMPWHEDSLEPRFDSDGSSDLLDDVSPSMRGLEPSHNYEDEGQIAPVARSRAQRVREPDHYRAPRPPRSYRGLARLIVVLAILGGLAGAVAWQWSNITALYSFVSHMRSRQTPVAQQPTAQPKISGRVPQEQAGQAPAAAPNAQAPAEGAQRVVLYEEDSSNPQGKQYVGSAVWRTETVSPGSGLAPELQVRADITIPDRNMTVTWKLRRNTDQALPASHTIEIMFNLPPDFPGGGVANVPGVLMKESEQARGVPLAGLAVKVTNGFFLIGLSAVDADVQRNMQLLKDRPWFDIPIVYNNGGRAILAMEKGPPGDRAFADAFAAWSK
jgi:hypothetical protein